MDRICLFYKENSGEWYIYLAEWEGDKSALQMVLGADTLLDIMAQGENKILVRFSTEGFPSADLLEWVNAGIPDDNSESGATYKLQSYNGIDYNFDVWLCDVTVFVFGEFPKYIYFSSLN